MRKIAESANILIGNIYKNFVSKEDLFDQLVSKVFESM
ncbi:TetR family transcriptional regulator [Metabacillus litoralis]